jgi:hypothetical protein
MLPHLLPQGTSWNRLLLVRRSLLCYARCPPRLLVATLLPPIFSLLSANSVTLLSIATLSAGS